MGMVAIGGIGAVIAMIRNDNENGPNLLGLFLVGLVVLIIGNIKHSRATATAIVCD